MDPVSGSAAPKGKRFAAAIIDLVIVPIVLGIIIGLLLLAASELVRSIVLVIVNIGWLVFRDSVYSPGRAMVGLKLVSLVGDKVTVGQAIVRNLLLMIPFVLIIGYPVEIMAILLKGNRIADGWAKTQVAAA